MNITSEQMNENHLKLVVNVNPDDYREKVEEEIKSLSKKITMNGFRPGKVPPGLAKKFYGNSVLAEQLDKLLNNSVTDYIKEHNLKVLGQPIPFEVKHQHIDIQQQQAYDFGFELGLIPDFQLAPLDAKKFERNVINVTDEMISEEIDRMRSMYGERFYPETAGGDDIVSGEWKELGENAEPKEEGIVSTSSFAVRILKDDVTRQVVMNLKKEESTQFNIKNAFGNDMELIIHNILKTDHTKADAMGDLFSFTLKNITHIEKAEVNQDLFDRAFVKGEVSSEEEMKDRIRKNLSDEYDKYTVSRLDREMQDYLVNETAMNLPVDFLRRLINTNKETDQPEVDDHQMSVYANQVRWELISNKIIQENQLEASREELEEKAKRDIANYYGGAALFNENTEALDRLSASLLSDEKYVGRMREQVVNDKIFELLRAKVSAEDKVVDRNEFFHH